MAATFQQVWRKVRLHIPGAPPFLCQEFVSEAYRDLCERGAWSWLRAESEIITSDAKTAGTVAVTRNSAAIVGTGTAWAATDVGRQFKADGTNVIYSISTVPDATHATLDRVFGGTTAASTTYRIYDAYVSMPTDFGHFAAVWDPVNSRPLNTTRNEDWLQFRDPQRTNLGDPTHLVARRLSSSGRIQYELWPSSVTARNYPILYIRRPEDLVDSTTFLSVLGQRSDILVAGALWKAAEWPGTTDQKNPYFNLALAANKKRQFEDMVNRLEVADQDVYLTWLEQVNAINHTSMPIGDDYAYNHAVSDAGGF